MADGHAVVGIENDAVAAEAAKDWCSHVLNGDVVDEATLTQAAEMARNASDLGGWVNCAAIQAKGTLLDVSRNEFAQTMAVNLEAYWWGCATAVSVFLEQGTPGAIVNVGSIHGQLAFAGWGPYDVAKGGVEQLTRYVAVEYGPHGIRCNGVAPGLIKVERVQRVLEAKAEREVEEAQLASRSPLHRLGQPEEIAAVARFLLSSEASYVSGQTLGVDGGWAASGARVPSPGLNPA